MGNSIKNIGHEDFRHTALDSGQRTIEFGSDQSLGLLMSGNLNARTQSRGREDGRAFFWLTDRLTNWLLLLRRRIIGRLSPSKRTHLGQPQAMDNRELLSATDPNQSGIVGKAVLQEIHLLPTSRCNLRCVYCGISGELATTDAKAEMTNEQVERITAVLLAGSTRTVCLSGGEVTFMENWSGVAKSLFDRAFSLNIITNLVRILTDDEIAMLC